MKTTPTTSTPDPRRATSSRWTRAALTFVGLVGVTLASQAVVAGVASAIVAIVAATGLLVVIRTSAERARAARASRVIAYVAQAARLALPLPEFCRIAARGETSGTRRALERLADFTAASLPVGDALVAAMPDMARRDVGLARAAESSGTLPSTLARLAAVREPTPGAATLANASPDDDGFVHPRPPFAYFAMLLVFTAAICGMLSVFVLPKFAQLFRDFRVPVPGWMHVVAGANPMGIDVRTASPLLVVAVVGVVVLTVVSRRVRRTAARGVVGPRWPIVDAWRHDRDCADVCQTIADALAAARPADVALGEAATLCVSATLAARTALWQTFVVGGQPIGAAARAARMPTLIGALAGDGASAAADAFAFLARHYRARAERTHEWLRAVASPALTVIAAIPIALIACALFDCLRRLADAAMPKNLGM